MLNNIGKQQYKNTGTTTREELNFPKKPLAARVVRVVDYGTQPDQDYTTGEEKKPVQKVSITFEFSGVRTGNGDPAWVSKEYPLRTSENAGIVKFLMEICPDKVYLKDGQGKWEGRKFVEFDKNFTWEDDVINAPVLASVGKTSGGYDKIVSVSAVPDGMPVPDLENDTLMYEMDAEQGMDNMNKEAYAKLHKFDKYKLKNEVDYGDIYDELLELEEEANASDADM